MWNHFKGILFHIFPHHLISRITFYLTRIKSPLKNFAIRMFIRTFDVDMSESIYKNAEDFSTFNDFFTRKLQAGSRPIDKSCDVICPADGHVSQLGNYNDGKIIQAKGRFFSITDLLGGENDYGAINHSGSFATVYLSPKNYHRVHMPMAGKLIEMIHVPGRLFSVAPYASEVIKNLYTRNERVVSIFSTDIGFMAVVMVGAVNVAAIEMSWAGLVTPPKGNKISRTRYEDVTLNTGDELGIFNMGSTAIIAFESKSITWNENLVPQNSVKMGQAFGKISS